MAEKSYLELKAEKEVIDRRMEEARKAELPKICEQIRKQIAEFGIRPEDLFPGFTRTPNKISSAPKGGTIKYRSPDGQTWGGGPGRKPNWVNEAIKAGKDIEQFRVD